MINKLLYSMMINLSLILKRMSFRIKTKYLKRISLNNILMRENIFYQLKQYTYNNYKGYKEQ